MVKIFEPKPGDRAIVKIPFEGKFYTVSVRVMKKEAKMFDSWVGCFVGHVSLPPENIKGMWPPEGIIEFGSSDILSLVPAEKNGITPAITMEISNGYIVSLVRTDGELEKIPIRVKNLDPHEDEIFLVDGAGATKIFEFTPVFPTDNLQIELI